jgi:invasion protein IalB
MSNSKRRAITALLAVLLLAFLLACGAAPLTQEEAQRQCRADPQCHPAPDWVVRERGK